MTLTEVRAMTPEEKRVKLAELLGWKWFNATGDNICWLYGPSNKHRPMEKFLMASPDKTRELRIADKRSLPDYCNDLNAVAQVERMLVTEDRDRTGTYESHLSIITEKRINPETESEFCYPMFATAEQRTTALILTLSQ